jgi:hypothetical protein
MKLALLAMQKNVAHSCGSISLWQKTALIAIPLTVLTSRHYLNLVHHSCVKNVMTARTLVARLLPEMPQVGKVGLLEVQLQVELVLQPRLPHQAKTTQVVLV